MEYRIENPEPVNFSEVNKSLLEEAVTEVFPSDTGEPKKFNLRLYVAAGCGTVLLAAGIWGFLIAHQEEPVPPIPVIVKKAAPSLQHPEPTIPAADLEHAPSQYVIPAQPAQPSPLNTSEQVKTVEKADPTLKPVQTTSQATVKPKTAAGSAIVKPTQPVAKPAPAPVNQAESMAQKLPPIGNHPSPYISGQGVHVNPITLPALPEKNSGEPRSEGETPVKPTKEDALRNRQILISN